MTAVAVATAALLILLVTRGHTARSERVLRQLPETAQAVLHVDVPAIADSASASILIDTIAGDRGLGEVETVCGFDPRVGLDQVTVWAGGPEGEPFRSIGLLLRGRTVDAEDLAHCYRAVVEARGSAVVRDMTVAGPWLRSRDGLSALAEVDSRTVVTGSTSTVDEFLAVKAGAVPSLIHDPVFSNLWRRSGPGGAIRGVFVAPPRWQSAFERIGTVGAKASALTGVEALGFGTRADPPTSVTLWLDIDDPTIARRDAALLDVWVSAPPDEVEEPWRTVVSSTRVDVDDDWITLISDLEGLRRP